MTSRSDITHPEYGRRRDFEGGCMIVGIVKELKDNENRVGLIPSFVSSLRRKGQEIVVETGAGVGSGFSDEEYLSAGATIAISSKVVYSKADMIVKVKEPQKAEYQLMRENQVVFSYMHLAPSLELTEALLKTKAICIAYETVTDDLGQLPLLAPMSAIAGRMSIMIGANLLQAHFGGCGLLASGVPGVASANVVILGGGYVGTNAAFVANGIGANVTVLDHNIRSLRKIDDMFKGNVRTIFSNKNTILEAIREADIVVGAAYVAGSSAPKLITRDMIKDMRKGSVIVDVSIDQGGCCETSHPMPHSDPYYEVDGVIHYCVSNMPGAYAKTATIALNDATYPFVEKITNLGYEKALRDDKHLLAGLNIYKGQITCEAVAKTHRKPCVKFEDLVS